MISDPNHEGRKAFFDIYKDDSNGTSVENLLTGNEAEKIQLFLASGLDIKIISDFISYRDHLKKDKNMLNDNPKLL